MARQLRASALGHVPSAEGAIADAAPTAAMIGPEDRSAVRVGETIYPLVGASDDFAVQSVTLLVDGVPVGVATSAPYTFAWTPTAKDAGHQVTFEASVVDSSGHTTGTHKLKVAVEK